MIAALMLYITLFSMLVGVAALAVERALALGSWPRRGLWVGAMALSLIGATGMTLGGHAPRIVTGETHTLTTAKPASGLLPIPASQALTRPLPVRRTAAAVAGQFLGAHAKSVWIGTSVLLLGIYAAGALRLRSARKRWQRQTVGKYPVFITPDLGPAVFGLLRPVIVLPRWLLNEPPETLDVALAHENQHIVARDPALLLAALLLLAVTAWNLPLWWQLRRLKLAIEIDCDTRVLRQGVQRRPYADALLRINRYAGTMPLEAIAIVGHISQLEQRIRAMMTERPRHLRMWVAGWTVVAMPLLVGATQLDPPSRPPSADSATQRVYLGIGLADLDVNAGAASVTAARHGAIVTYVNSGSVAEHAGIRRGDLIVEFAATPVTNARALAKAVAQLAPDARVPVLIERAGVDQTLTADFSILPPPRVQTAQPIDTSDWDALRDAHLPIAQPQLRDELIQMAQLPAFDQLLKAVSQGAPLPPDTSGISVGPRMEPGSNEAHVRRLKAIIDQYGWPTVSMVGVRGATAAGMIASAARNDPAFQAEVLKLMEPLLRRDEVPTMYYAGMFDAVHMPQRFGMLSECVNGELKPTKPIEDPQHLQERRSALGLPKLAKFCIGPPVSAPAP
ncbi:MAG TPA: M56 family metallopeptidase [Steroidobacteraceae bacterium]|jgi:hypothetical protein